LFTRRFLPFLAFSLIIGVIGCGGENRAAPAAEDAPASPPAPPPNPQRNIRSAFYNFTLMTYAGLVPPPDRPRAGGSVAAFRDGFLLVTAAGDFFRLSWQPGTDSITAERLPVSVPFNRADLLKASSAELAAPFRITTSLSTSAAAQLACMSLTITGTAAPTA
jgi:hypothetical protein